MYLYELNTTKVINKLVKEVMENHPEFPKDTAKAIVLNALIGNCVHAEIMEQVEFLIENNGYEPME